MTSTSELLLRYDRKRARSQQVELGMSEVGGCRRRAGYRLAGTPPTNPTGSVQAAMGTAIHEVVAREMAEVAEPGDLVEHEVRFAGLVGHLDRYEAAAACVRDTKTTSSRWLEHLKLHGPDENHRWQITLYGAALTREGRPVQRTAIDYLARDTGEEWTSEAPFRPDLYARAALEWLRRVRETPVQYLPRDYTPDSTICHTCPFAELCWPAGLESKTAMAVLYEEDPDAAKWADELWEARETIKKAKEREKRAKGALEAIRPDAGMGIVATRGRWLSYRSNGLYFAPNGGGPIPALGYDEEAS
jgi:PD-(D/E)XK nuclease superfamily